MLRRSLYYNFRFIYKISRFVRNRFTGNGILLAGAMVIAGVFGFDTRQTLSFQIFSILVCLLFLSLICSFFFRGHFQISRKLPANATVGVPLNYKLQIENTGKNAQADLLLTDQLFTRFPEFSEFASSTDPLDHQRNRFDRFVGYPRLMRLIQQRRGGFIYDSEPVEVTGNNRAYIDSTLLPIQRGWLQFDHVLVTKPDPFGLLRSQKKFSAKDKLLVYPRYFPLNRLSLTGSRKYQPQGRTTGNRSGDSEEFLCLREYRVGDPLKKIHWKSFARFNKPVIKEFHDEYCDRRGLILDTFRSDKPERLFEDAVSVAASFALADQQPDTQLDLMFIEDKSYCFSSGNGKLSQASMLEILACVQPGTNFNINALEQLALKYINQCSVYIMILLDWDEPRRTLVRSLRQQGMTVLTVILREDKKTTDLDTDPMLGQPEHLFEVRSTHIDEDLNSLTVTT